MTAQIWRGDAPAIAQVVTGSVSGDDAATTYKVTINSKVVSVAGSGSGVNTTAANLVTSLKASQIPEFLEVTWANPTGASITGTAVKAGVPFTATLTASGGTGTVSAFSTTTANSGPSDIGLTANYVSGSLPANNDTLTIPPGTAPLLYNLTALNNVTLTTLTVMAGFTSNIGLALVNQETGTGYYEYRPTALQIGASNTRIGDGAGTGSGLIRLDYQVVQNNTTVLTSGSTTILGTPSICLKGTNANNTLSVEKGDVGVAVFAGETANLATLRVGYVQNQISDATLTLGTGLTLATTLDMTGGTVNCHCNLPTTTTMQAGMLTIDNSATGGTVNVYGGQFNWWSTGNVTTINGGPSNPNQQVTIDATANVGSVTLTNCTLYTAVTFNDPDKRITFTNPVALKAPLISMTLNLGSTFNLQRS